MIFPTLAVVVGTLLALGDASKAEDITKMKAAREKALAGRGIALGQSINICFDSYISYFLACPSSFP
jgi:hypothetical protein